MNDRMSGHCYIGRDETIQIDYDHYMHNTEAAHLFKIDGEEHWIPDSQIEHHDKILKQFTIPEWLAEEKGLI